MKLKPWLKRVSLIPVAFVIFWVLFGSVVVECFGPKYFVHGRDFPYDALPANSTDVRLFPLIPFCPVGRTYEFKCSEEEFLEWASGWREKIPKLGEIQIKDRGFYDRITSDGGVKVSEMGEHAVTGWTFEDRGIYFVYDRTNGRALRTSHSR